MILQFIQKNKKGVIGALLGAIGGAAYYYFVGCKSGSCIISSNPFISVPYGGLMGYLIAGIFTKKEPVKTETHETS
jgi:hypothetical protein